MDREISKEVRQKEQRKQFIKLGAGIGIAVVLIGGVIGIGLSMVLLVVGKPFMLSENVSLTAPMLIKPGLFISALIFTFLLNILSAGIPAWRTTRQPIVEALKGNE